MVNIPIDIFVKARDQSAAVFANINKKLKNVSRSIMGIESNMGRANARIQKAGSGMTKSFNNVGMAGQIASGMIGIGMLSAVDKMVQAESDLSKAVAEVSTLMDDSAISTERMRKSVLALSEDSGKSAVDITQGMYDIVSASFQGEDAFKVLKATTDMAVGGVSEVAVSADLLTTILNSYGMSADEATVASDKMFMTVKLGKTRINDLAGSLGRVLPIAKAAGVSLDEVGGAMAELTKSGLDTNEAATGLRAALKSMVSPGVQAAEMAKELGLEFTDVNGQLRDLDDIMADISKLKLTPKQMAVLFPEMSASVAVQSLTASHEDLAKAIDEVGDSAGATAAANKKIKESSAFMLEKTRAEFFKLMAEFGESLIPVLAMIVDILGPMLDAFSALPKPIKTVMVSIMGLIGAMALLLPMIMMGIVPALEHLGIANLKAAASFRVLGVSIKSMTASLLIALALLWGWDAAATKIGDSKYFEESNKALDELVKQEKGASAEAVNMTDRLKGSATPLHMIWYWYHNWGKEIDTMSAQYKAAGDQQEGFFDGIKESLSGVIPTILGTWDKVTVWTYKKLIKFNETIKNILVTGLTSIPKLIYEDAKRIGDAIIDPLMGVVDWTVSLPEIIAGHIIAAAETIIDGFTLSVDWLRELPNLIKGYVEKFVALIIKAFTGIKDPIVEKLEATRDGIIAKFDAIIDFMKSLPDKFKQFGRDMVQGMVDGINEQKDKIVEAFRDPLQRLSDELPHSPAKTGPLSKEPNWKDYLKVPAIDLGEFRRSLSEVKSVLTLDGMELPLLKIKPELVSAEGLTLPGVPMGEQVIREGDFSINIEQVTLTEGYGWENFLKDVQASRSQRGIR